MKSILVVDDSAVSRMVLSRALEDEGYDVSTADDAYAALDWVGQNPDVDLVITDYHMPAMGGLDLVLYLRADQSFRRKPIFVLTTDADDQEQRKMREAGATGWIIKPFDKAKLVNAIERVTH